MLDFETTRPQSAVAKVLMTRQMRPGATVIVTSGDRVPVKVPAGAYLRFQQIETADQAAAFLNDYGWLGVGGEDFAPWGAGHNAARRDRLEQVSAGFWLQSAEEMRWVLAISTGKDAQRPTTATYAGWPMLFQMGALRTTTTPDDLDVAAALIEQGIQNIQYAVYANRPDGRSADTRPVVLELRPRTLYAWLWWNCASAISGGRIRRCLWEGCKRPGGLFEVGGDYGSRRSDARFCGEAACFKAYSRKYGSIRPMKPRRQKRARR